MYRKYYSYSDMPQLVTKKETEKCVREEKPLPCEKKPADNGKILGRFEADDVLLAVIIAALLLDENADSTLLLALAFVFLTGLL